MFPRMYSSVKFLEPTVSWIPLLAEFDLIRLAELPPLVPVSLSSSPPPQAATPSASTSAAISAKAALVREWPVITDPPLVWGLLHPLESDPVILCCRTGPREL